MVQLRLDAEAAPREWVATGERSVSFAKIAVYYTAHLAVRVTSKK